jgi:hypothetical protein
VNRTSYAVPFVNVPKEQGVAEIGVTVADHWRHSDDVLDGGARRHERGRVVHVSIADGTRPGRGSDGMSSPFRCALPLTVRPP